MDDVATPKARYLRVKGAFTLIELLVVIAIIGLLIAILIPAMSVGMEHARRSVCTSNLKQTLTALHIYAADNDGELPLGFQGHWPHDLVYSISDIIIASGGDKKTFYCPSDHTLVPGDPRLWQFSQRDEWFPGGGRPPLEPKTGRDNEYRITGYFWQLDLLKTVGGRNFDNTNGGDHPPYGDRRWVSEIPGNYPPDMEIVTDRVFSTDPDPGASRFVLDGSWEVHGVTFRTNHMSNTADGGNIGMIDGHVEWRNFSDMEIHFGDPRGAYLWW